MIAETAVAKTAVTDEIEVLFIPPLAAASQTK
jgi:hypothetical protein